MKKPTSFYCDLYRQNIYLFYEWSELDFKKYMLKNYEFSNDRELGDGQCAQFKYEGQGDIFVVWVSSGLKRPLEVLIHEIVHLKNLIFLHVGHQLSRSNDEHEAYYTQRLFHGLIGK